VADLIRHPLLWGKSRPCPTKVMEADDICLLAYIELRRAFVFLLDFAYTLSDPHSPGVLAYGSPFSRSRRDLLNAMCDGLPVPVPSLQHGGMAYGQPCGISAHAFSGAFNNAHGGCFASGTLILMADGTSLPIDRLRKGDKVRVPAASSETGGSHSVCSAEVVCMVRHSDVRTVRLPVSGLRITPWHPIRIDGHWAFPADVVSDAHLAAADGARGNSIAQAGG